MAKMKSARSLCVPFVLFLLEFFALAPWGYCHFDEPFAVATAIAPETNDSDEVTDKAAKCDKDLDTLKLFAGRLGNMSLPANQDLLFKAYESYYKMILAGKLQETRQSAIAALQANRNQALEFYKTGVVPKTDVLALESALASARSKLEQCSSEIVIAATKLNFILKYRLCKEWKTEACFEHSVIPYSEPEIYRIAVQHRPDMVQKGISFEEATRALFSDSTGSKTTAFVREIMVQIRLEYHDMKRSCSLVPERIKTIEFSRELFRINQERYKEQVATYIEVLDSQRMLGQAQEDYYIDFVNYRIRRASLERQMGILHRFEVNRSSNRQ